MSTDVYIDVFLPEAIRPIDDDLREDESMGCAAIDTKRLGYSFVLMGLRFNWLDWLRDYAHATDLIDHGVVEAVQKTYRLLRRVNEKLQTLNPEWVAIRYSFATSWLPPYDDIISEEDLVAFLSKHHGLHWRIRVD